MTGYAAEFVTKFSRPLETFMTNGVSQLANAIKGPLVSGATLYIVIFGILILLGYVRAPIQEFIINVFRIILIVLLATKSAEYNYYVKDLFFKYIPDGIGGIIGQSPGGGTSTSDVLDGKAFDTVANQIIVLASTIYREWTWSDWYPLVATCLVLFGLIPIAALLAVVLLAKVGLSLVLVLGPVFVALYMFRPTQSFTLAWVSALVNFATLQVLAVTFITLLMSILTDFVKDAQSQGAGEQITASFNLVLIFVLALALASQLPAISAHLAGGGFQIGASLIHSGVNASRTAADKTRSALQKAMQKAVTTLMRSRSGGSMQKD